MLAFLFLLSVVSSQPVSDVTQAATSGTVFTVAQQAQLKKLVLQWFNTMTAKESIPGQTIALLVRLSFHEAATSGSRACLQPFSDCSSKQCEFNAPENKGLQSIITALGTFYTSGKIKATFGLSSSDFWVYVETIAINLASGGKLEIPFQYGRPECGSVHYSGGVNIPDPASPSIQQYTTDFTGHFGFSIQETVALLGAHSLGGMLLQNSGFSGSWTASTRVLDNSYYKNLLGNTWRATQNSAGNIQWGNGNGQTMLPSDMGLAYNHQLQSVCNGVTQAANRNCAPRGGDWTVWIKKYANDNTLFMKDFGAVFQKMQQFGVRGLQTPSL